SGHCFRAGAPRQKYTHHQQRCRHRTDDEGVRNVHPPFLCPRPRPPRPPPNPPPVPRRPPGTSSEDWPGVWTSTRAPSCTLSMPSSTTFSPALRPDAIATSFPSVALIVTIRSSAV